MMTLPGLALFTAAWSGRRTFSLPWRTASSPPRSCRSCGGCSATAWPCCCFGSYLGDFARIALMGIGIETISPLAKTIPEILFMAYQMTSGGAGFFFFASFEYVLLS